MSKQPRKLKFRGYAHFAEQCIRLHMPSTFRWSEVRYMLEKAFHVQPANNGVAGFVASALVRQGLIAKIDTVRSVSGSRNRGYEGKYVKRHI
jgi:hypothetical protein